MDRDPRGPRRQLVAQEGAPLLALPLAHLETDVLSLVEQEIVTARTYGHDLVIFADGFSFFIGVVVQVEPHLYHVLISDLERLAPPAPSTSLYYAVHVAAFYTKLAEMAQHFRALAINLAATAARAGPAADPAVDGRNRGEREQQGGHVQSGTSVDTIADGASRLSLDDSVRRLALFPRLRSSTSCSSPDMCVCSCRCS